MSTFRLLPICNCPACARGYDTLEAKRLVQRPHRLGASWLELECIECGAKLTAARRALEDPPILETEERYRMKWPSGSARRVEDLTVEELAALGVVAFRWRRDGLARARVVVALLVILAAALGALIAIVFSGCAPPEPRAPAFTECGGVLCGEPLGYCCRGGIGGNYCASEACEVAP